MIKTIDRLNEERYNNFGSLMIIMQYRSSVDIDVYFPEYNYTVTNREYNDFKKGTIKCPFEPRFYNVGYIGIGDYKISSTDQKYIVWNNMLRRCYCSSNLENKTYIHCEVNEEWHNFQNFARWYDNNYYEIPGEKMFLDKDILIKGNKIYGPDTCCFVPRSINNLFTLRNSERGQLPLGVQLSNSKKNPYRVAITKNNKRITLGHFNNVNEAFLCYKQAKEEYLKEIADNYVEYLPIALYNALYDYEVQLED